MNFLQTISALLALAVAATSFSSAQDLPTLTQLLPTTRGEQTSLAKLGAASVTVVTFWGCTCKSCREALRMISPVVERYGEAAQFIAVSIDGVKTMSKVAPFVTSKGYEFPVVLDPARTLFAAVNGTEVPLILVFSADGALVARLQGFMAGDEKKVEEELIRMLGSPQDETNAPAES